MHSENNSGVQPTPRRTFIEEARRNQIVAAAIETLAELGYGRASMAQIARRAKISPSLIVYHFRDKDALVYQTLIDIANAWESFVAAQVAEANSPSEQLRNYIAANLTYMGTRPNHYAALIEIMFNARTEDGILLYRLDEEDTGLVLLNRVLVNGQQRGAFRPFNVQHMALAIRGAINEFLGEMHKSGANLEMYTADIVDMFLRATALE
jgi:TetR/AcrR family transcriptional regulator, transcriptional repressor of bet genes